MPAERIIEGVDTWDEPREVRLIPLDRDAYLCIVDRRFIRGEWVKEREGVQNGREYFLELNNRVARTMRPRPTQNNPAADAVTIIKSYETQVLEVVVRVIAFNTITQQWVFDVGNI